MSLPKRGKVYLGVKVDGAFPAAARFNTDPRISRAWTPRRSVLPGIGGSVTHQDFGRFAKDMKLTLTSQGNWIDGTFKKYLDSLQLTRGNVFEYEDYQGVEAEVAILDFEATPTFFGGGLNALWEYRLELQVVSLSKLDFATYTGS